MKLPRPHLVLWFFVLLSIAVTMAAKASTDEEVIVYFNRAVLVLPSAHSSVGPDGLVSCDSTLQSVMISHGVDLLFRAVPEFDAADTLFVTPDGLAICMPDLSLLYVMHTAPGEVAELVGELTNLPGVVYAERNAHAVVRLVPNDEHFDLQWSVNNQSVRTVSPEGDVRAIQAWDLTTGSASVLIGIEEPSPGVVWPQHPDLQGRVTGETAGPFDDHATHVAGIAAATGDNGEGIAGVDWNCGIVTRSFSSNAGLVDDIHYLVNRDVTAINHSWGRGEDCDYLVTDAWALALAYKANALNVIAMPEEGKTCIYPNAYGLGLSVAATGPRGQKASYSIPHSFVDIAAPGGEYVEDNAPIYSAMTQPPDDPYGDMFGTSMAAPHVTGAAGLLKAYDPSLYNDDIAGLLRFSSDDLNSPSFPGFDNDLGWGRLNIRAAINRLRPPYSLVRPTANGGSVHATLASDGFLFIDLPGQADGMYMTAPVEVRRSVTFAATYAEPPNVWGRGVETVGYANMNPNYTIGWCEPVGAVTKTGCTLRTYVYDLYTVLGAHVGWYPCEPANVRFAYSISGIEDHLPPTATVITPNGGETVSAGHQVTIGWQVTDEYLPGVRCTLLLDLVTESGTSVWLIASDQPVILGGIGTYNWAIPQGMPGDNRYKIRVVARDTNDHQGVDSSDNPFTIEPWTGHNPPPPPPPCEMPCYPAKGWSPEYVTDLLPVSPNPFNPDTRFRFTLKGPDEVALRVYDVRGRLVKTIVDGFQAKGLHEVPWDGADGNGRALPSGVYFAAFTADQRVFTQKLVILR